MNDKITNIVTAKILDTMYNNFIKLTDWVVKGKQSQYPMPAGLKQVFDLIETVASLQTIVAKQQEQIDALHAMLNNQQPAPVQQPAPATPMVSPNEEALVVSAQQVDAGNLSPEVFAQLDAEIEALQNSLK